MTPKFVIAHGPNLNWLGRRETKIYGTRSWEAIWKDLCAWSKQKEIQIGCFQSNYEGALIDFLQESDEKADGILLNPGALAHTSIALRDCIASLERPVVEVHLSKIQQRETFRHHSYIADVAQGCITGFGEKGYFLGLELLLRLTKKS